MIDILIIIHYYLDKSAILVCLFNVFLRVRDSPENQSMEIKKRRNGQFCCCPQFYLQFYLSLPFFKLSWSQLLGKNELLRFWSFPSISAAKTSVSSRDWRRRKQEQQSLHHSLSLLEQPRVPVKPCWHGLTREKAAVAFTATV